MAFHNPISNVMALRQKERISDTNQATLYVVGNAAEAFGFRSMCGSDLVGNPMKSAIAAHLPDEHFIIPRRWTSKIAPSTFLGCTERRLAASGSVSAARRKSTVDPGG
jgi:hypothetical protein